MRRIGQPPAGASKSDLLIVAVGSIDVVVVALTVVVVVDDVFTDVVVVVVDAPAIELTPPTAGASDEVVLLDVSAPEAVVLGVDPFDAAAVVELASAMVDDEVLSDDDGADDPGWVGATTAAATTDKASATVVGAATVGMAVAA